MTAPAATLGRQPALQLLALAGFAAVAGIVWGIFCGWADLHGSEVVSLTANSAGPWLLLAFLVGTRARSVPEGVLAGVIALTSGIAAYYVAHEFGGQAANRESMLATRAWAPVAIAAGATFGAAGRSSLSKTQALRLIAVALIGGALVAEGVLILEESAAGSSRQTFAVTEMAVGLLMPMLILRNGERLQALGLLAIAAILSYVFEQALLEAVRESLRR